MKKGLIPAVLFVPMVAGLMLLGGCGDKGSSASVATPSGVSTSAPVQPQHFYVIQDEGAYGYEQAISPDDVNKGRAAANVLMVHYLGRRGEVHQVMVKEGKTRVITECSTPCEFAKIYTFWGNEFADKKIMKITPDALLAVVFKDVSNGYLKQYTGKQQGKPVQFWVDGEAKKLTVSAADAL